ncbi:MAG: enoyl-[acyl-carrier-protein] reductase FabK [Negativicutes bacterium]|nr:enoyl-[acyl-carrier-protein] reductase FabK [Negativicutes bacterium]
MLNTGLCRLLNIKYPILQGGMAWVATAELAAAVSNAGGLGLIGAGHMPPEPLRDEIRKAKAATNKPFGVNIMLMSPFVNEVMQVVVEERVPVITTGAGNPAEYIPALKEIGCKVIPVVASVALARKLERYGIDAVIAEGMESGGHVGEITTMALVPQVVDAVKVPVIAAGGIGDARGVVAAFALGAQGVQIGTRFVASTECTAHANYKDVIIRAKDRSTVVTGLSSGHPVRIINNKLSREFDELERRGASPAEFDHLGAGKLKAAARDGDIRYGSVMVGQIAGMVKCIQPVDSILQEIINGVPQVIRQISRAAK